MRPATLNPKRVWMEEKDCERMNRYEFEAIRGLLGAVSYTAHANQELQKRLECIPSGKQRLAMILGGLRAISDDLISTMPVGQCRQIRNTMRDMEMRMVPKMTPISQNVILDKDVAKDLIDAAQEKCKRCAEDEVSCRKCTLYKILEATVPVDDFTGYLICPYAISEWEE